MDNSTHTYWLSIGRNVGADPMTTGLWLAFRSEVETAARHSGGTILATVEGESTGQWPEETYLVLVEVPAHTVTVLRSNLSNLCAHYGQEAIGCVGGADQTLVAP